MIFVFGGAHQGMEEYALNRCGVDRICALSEMDEEIDFSAPAISALEQFVFGCVKRGESAVEYFQKHEEAWRDDVLIGMDFSCGVVPMDAQLRQWREENGRLNNYLAGRAERVVRMFCGIAQVLK